MRVCQRLTRRRCSRLLPDTIHSNQRPTTPDAVAEREERAPALVHPASDRHVCPGRARHGAAARKSPCLSLSLLAVAQMRLCRLSSRRTCNSADVERSPRLGTLCIRSSPTRTLTLHTSRTLLQSTVSACLSNNSWTPMRRVLVPISFPLPGHVLAPVRSRLRPCPRRQSRHSVQAVVYLPLCRLAHTPRSRRTSLSRRLPPFLPARSPAMVAFRTTVIRQKNSVRGERRGQSGWSNEDAGRMHPGRGSLAAIQPRT